MNDKERLLLHALRSDSRQRLTLLAEASKSPLSTTHDRLNRLRRARIMRPVSLIDYPRLGTPLRCWFFVQANDKEILRQVIEELGWVNKAQEVHSKVDFVIECVFPGFKQQHETAQLLKEHGKLSVHPVVEALQEESATCYLS